MTTGSCWPSGRGGKLTPTWRRVILIASRRTSGLLVGMHGAGPVGGHGLFLVARQCPSGLPEPSPPRMPMALAGGVNLMLTPDLTINFCKARMLSPGGRCKTFDESADGFARGEGCGMVALKRLSEAQAAGDDILAVIRGSFVNQDGRTSGLTVPHGPSQQTVIRRALEDARFTPGRCNTSKPMAQLRLWVTRLR